MNSQTMKQSIAAAIIVLIIAAIGAFVLLLPAWSSARDAERSIVVLEQEAARDVNPLIAVPPRESPAETAAQIRRLAPAGVAIAKITSGRARLDGALMRTDHVVRVQGPSFAVGDFIQALNDAITREGGTPRGAANARLFSVIASDVDITPKQVASGTVTVRSFSRRAQDAPVTATP